MHTAGLLAAAWRADQDNALAHKLRKPEVIVLSMQTKDVGHVRPVPWTRAPTIRGRKQVPCTKPASNTGRRVSPRGEQRAGDTPRKGRLCGARDRALGSVAQNRVQTAGSCVRGHHTGGRGAFTGRPRNEHAAATEGAHGSTCLLRVGGLMASTGGRGLTWSDWEAVGQGCRVQCCRKC